MESAHIAILIYSGSAFAIIAFAIWHFDRKQRRTDEARRAAKLERERERVANLLQRPASVPRMRAVSSPINGERRSSARSFSSPSPSPAPQPDYLAQHLMWQSLSTPSPSPTPSYEPSCRADSYRSGGGGDFGGGGASSSWESSGSSDSSSSSSDSSSSSSSSD